MDLYHYRPQAKFSQKHMLKLTPYTPDEIYQILSLALQLKQQKKQGVPHPLLSGKTLGMIFTKNSTRTRVSFEAGMYQLGGYALFLSSNDIQLRRGETIADTAKVLSRMVDGIMIRTYDQKDVEDLAKYGSIPVINGLTDDYHPCQILADLMTVYEYKGELAGRKMAYVGDGNNIVHSLLLGCAKVGMNLSVATPKGFEPRADIVKDALEIAQTSGAKIQLTNDPKEAAAQADAIYTDVWASMGQEAEKEEKHKAFAGYQVDEKLMSCAKQDAIFLHCLPAHRGEEVAAEVIDGRWSAVFDEAENRLHAQKALMVLLMKGND